MKVLFISTYGDFLATFEMSNITLWQDLGAEVHCASNFSDGNYNLKIGKLDQIGVIKHDIQFERDPLKIKNIFSFSSLIRLIREENIDVIDCHNAVVGFYARLAAKKCGLSKVIYTPHSFFFYNGCPLKNRLIYKNVENFMARSTDLLITINKEDYSASLQMPLRGSSIYVPGVGIDTNAIFNLPNDRKKLCSELKISEDSIIFISVGELIRRKNHETAIRAFAKANIPNSIYCICGIGELTDELRKVVEELKVQDRVKLLGYRLDAKELMKMSDVFIFPSYQEGLPVALMEAMACGLPCIVSRIRGNVDLIEEGKGGLFFDPDNPEQLANNLIKVVSYINKGCDWGKFNQNRVKEFDIENVRKIMRRVYGEFLK